MIAIVNILNAINKKNVRTSSFCFILFNSCLYPRLQFAVCWPLFFSSSYIFLTLLSFSAFVHLSYHDRGLRSPYVFHMHFTQNSTQKVVFSLYYLFIIITIIINNNNNYYYYYYNEN